MTPIVRRREYMSEVVNVDYKFAQIHNHGANCLNQD